MHETGETKTYAIDIETVSQGKRANDYTDNKKYKAPSNFKDELKIEANIEAQRKSARGKHGLHWVTGKVLSVALVDVYGSDKPICIKGVDEALVLEGLRPYMQNNRLIGKTSKNFDFPFLIGRYMANGGGVPRTLRTKNMLFDVDDFFGYSAASLQRGKLDDYAHGIGYKEKPMNGSAVQALYDSILNAKMEHDKVAEAALWAQLEEYNIHDCEVVKQMTLAYYGVEGVIL